MNAREKTNRDNQIVAARMRGLSWATIAGTYELSEASASRSLRTIARATRACVSVTRLSFWTSCWTATRALRRSWRRSRTTTHDATRVGAIRTRLDALAAQTNLLMLVGVLPRNLGQLRHDLDVQELARKTVAVFDRHGVPIEAKRELLLVLRANGH